MRICCWEKRIEKITVRIVEKQERRRKDIEKIQQTSSEYKEHLFVVISVGTIVLFRLRILDDNALRMVFMLNSICEMVCFKILS